VSVGSGLGVDVGVGVLVDADVAVGAGSGVLVGVGANVSVGLGISVDVGVGFCLGVSVGCVVVTAAGTVAFKLGVGEVPQAANRKLIRARMGRSHFISTSVICRSLGATTHCITCKLFAQGPSLCQKACT
jgi:hypothetical protein